MRFDGCKCQKGEKITKDLLQHKNYIGKFIYSLETVD